MSLAPEQKQVVKRGWPAEGGVKGGGGKVKDVVVAGIPPESSLALGLSEEGGGESKEEKFESALTIKELARKIHGKCQVVQYCVVGVGLVADFNYFIAII